MHHRGARRCVSGPADTALAAGDSGNSGAAALSAAATHCQKGCVKGPQATQSPTEGVARPREACGERAGRVLAESKAERSLRLRKSAQRVRTLAQRFDTDTKPGREQARKRLPLGARKETWASYAQPALRRTQAVVRTKRQSASKCCRKSVEEASARSALCLSRGPGSSHRGERA